MKNFFGLKIFMDFNYMKYNIFLNLEFLWSLVMWFSYIEFLWILVILSTIFLY